MEVEQGTAQIETTGKTFSQISSAVTDMVDNIQTVSGNLTEIASNNQMMNNSIEEIASVSEEAESSKQLTELAEELNELITGFKL